MSLPIIYDQMREDCAKQLGLLQAVIKDLASDIMKTLVLLQWIQLPTFWGATAVEEEMGNFL